jgi:transposase
MDFGWKSFRYEIRNHENQVLARGGAPATPEGLKKVLAKYTPHAPVQVAFEAGAQMYWIDQVVKEAGHESYPFHAAHLQMLVKSKNKTDKKDAEKIVRAAVKENLPPRIYVPGREEKELRERLTERGSYQKDLNRLGNRLHALAIEEGFCLDKKSLSRKIENWDAALKGFAGSGQERKAQRLYQSALNLFQILEEIEEEIKALVSEGELGRARKRLETIPGVGFWTAACILAWSGVRASRFATGRQAAAYFGLTCGTYESGQLSRPGHITKSGPPLVRKWLTQAAWAFINSRAGKASVWGKWQSKMTSRNKDLRKKATVALARRILTAAVACLRNETDWNPEVLRRER